MQLHPTRPTLHVAVAGIALVALGAAARQASVVGFGGAMLLAVALGRAIALVSITKLRGAGFELVWTGTTRVFRVARGRCVILEAELRNRSGDPVRCIGVRALVSSMLSADVEPSALLLSGGGRATITVTVHAKRVGRWGVHGLALEARSKLLGGEGLYEVPLLFASPVGIEVLPRPLAIFGSSPRGGRARRGSETGRRAALAGDGDELRELRDHAPGDPFRRIAWKASARRGRLLVREMDRNDRGVVWLIVDASVELLAGEPGKAPLDCVIDEAAEHAARCLQRGDRVGLIIVSSRVQSWIPPAEGAAHGAAIARALVGVTSCIDADRSELDENGVAQRVIDHARPLDPQGLADVPRGDLGALARRTEALRTSGPFAAHAAFGRTAQEKALRHYLAAFGLESPPRAAGEHAGTEVALAQCLASIATLRPRATVVQVWALPPIRPQATAKAISMLKTHRIELRWNVPPLDAGIVAGRGRRSPVADVVDDAVRARARAMMARGERLLRRIGVRFVGRGTRMAGPSSRAEASRARQP